MAQTLEEALIAYAAKHKLTSVQIGHMPVDGRVVWTAFVHWDGYSSKGNTCESSHSGESISEALRLAVAAAAVDRKHLYSDVEPPAFDGEAA